jgi:nucleoside-diphosphate-sugar epimerase
MRAESGGKMKRVLVTGANGFVGRTLCETLAARGYVVRAATRADASTPAAEQVVVGDLGPRTDWGRALEDVDAIVHLAARVHSLDDRPADAEAYFDVNVRGTERLAEAAVRAGVARFVFLSSVKVNGDGRAAPYRPDDPPSPRGPYAQSKAKAERSLLELAARSSLEVVCVRSPLVYGPGVRANFLRLLDGVHAQRRLPLGGVANRRSLVNVWNLCDLLAHVVEHRAAAGRIWLASDAEDVSTAELIRRIAAKLGKSPRLFYFPPALLLLAGRLVGKGAEVARLCESLVVDVGATRRDLGWSPPVGLDEGLDRTVRWYLNRSAPV